MAELRTIEAPFVVCGPSGVAVRDRLKNLTAADEQVLRLVGAHLGALASGDLKRRCADGLEHDNQTWAARKRELTVLSSSRWAGAITKASHDQWAPARRCQAAHIADLEAAIATIEHRLSLPVGEKASRKGPGGYRSAQERHAESRRLRVLTDRLQREKADQQAGRVRIVRGGKRLARTRHHLDDDGLTKDKWQAARWFLAADGDGLRRQSDRHRRPRLSSGETGEARPPQTLASAHLRHAHQ
jgi:hypothetical protein